MPDAIWAADLLGREKEARLLIDFLVRRSAERSAEGRRGSYVINVNASWGRGKSFFLERMRDQLQHEGHVAAYVNAWRDDANSEPMVAVMSAIEATLKPYLGKRPKAKKMFAAAVTSGSELLTAGLKGAASQATKRFLGNEFAEIARAIGDDTLLSTDAAKDLGEVVGEGIGEKVAALTDAALAKRIAAYHQRQRSVDTFKMQMSRLVEQLASGSDVNAPLFVLIDELDRCRPTYAIAMLEEIKHLFDIDGVVFVVATDTDQLSHAVKAVYGEGFDSSSYLHRFFHRRYLLEEPEKAKFVDYLFRSHQIPADKLASPPNDDHVSFFVGAMRQFDLSLRDAEQCFDMLRSFATVWPYRVPIQLLYLLPLIIAHQRGALGMLSWPGPFLNDYANRPEPWVVFFTHRRDAQGRVRPSWIKVLDLVSQLHGYLQHPIHEVISGESAPPETRWIYEQFRLEQEVVHGNRIDQQRPNYSILRFYADAVRKVGRLTELESNANS